MKKINYQTDEQKEMIHFLIVLGVIIVFVFGVYLISKIFVLDKNLIEVTYQDGTVNYERAIVGTMFNRPEKEYYVMIYDEKNNRGAYYSAISTKYSQSEKGLKVYHIDLGSTLNSSYYESDGNSNKNATKPSEVKLKDLTLIKIKNGKITKYLENISEIEKELAVS